MRKKRVDKCTGRRRRDNSIDPYVKDENLIALVKENPVLYNREHRNYGSRLIKSDTWNMIKVQCGISSVEKLKDRWMKLRNYFAIKLRDKNAKLPGARRGVYTEKGEWYLAEHMSFLTPHIMRREDRRSKRKRRSYRSCVIKISTPVAPHPVISKILEVGLVKSEGYAI